MNLAINARDAMPSGGGSLIETADAELDPIGCALDRAAPCVAENHEHLGSDDLGSADLQIGVIALRLVRAPI